ncbi:MULTISPECIES: hypothetical protein [unclassified Chryseobacterium]|uniref:hypothetical protein n=1 Tax=unclassified Chryseobacterium TaxID=2593645 RepID=UPI00226A9DC2|nr:MULTISPECIES: hypothetical protein [unclassified Chryseobacterium]
MKNYKKLLFAGLAIVPMALSSWTSNDQNINFQNGDGSKLANEELVGTVAATSSVTVKTQKKVISVSTIQEVSVAEKTVATGSGSLEPVLSLDKIVNDYK